MRFTSVASLAFKSSVLDATSYPFSFWLGLSLKLVRVGLIVVFFEAIFARVPSVAGWTRNEVLLMVGSYYVMDFLAKATFFRNLMFFLPQQIRRGEFDQYLVRPLPILEHVSFRRLDLLDGLSFTVMLAGTIFALISSSGSWDLPRILVASAYLMVGYLVLWGVALLGSSLFFRAPEGEGIAYLVNELGSLGRLPATVYPRPVLLSALFVVPIGLVALVPVGIVVGKITPTIGAASALAGWLFFLIARVVWYRQLRAYESASG